MKLINEIEHIVEQVEHIQDYYVCGLGSHYKMDHIYMMTAYIGFLEDERKNCRDKLSQIYYAHNKLMGVV